MDDAQDCLAAAIRRVLTGRTPEQEERAAAYADRAGMTRSAYRRPGRYDPAPVERLLPTHPDPSNRDCPPLPPEWKQELHRLVRDRWTGRRRRRRCPFIRFPSEQDRDDWVLYFLAAAVGGQIAVWSKAAFFGCVNTADREWRKAHEAFSRGSGIGPGRPSAGLHPDPAYTYSPPGPPPGRRGSTDRRPGPTRPPARTPAGTSSSPYRSRSSGRTPTRAEPAVSQGAAPPT